jgi:hypothetical protein
MVWKEILPLHLMGKMGKGEKYLNIAGIWTKT